MSELVLRLLPLFFYFGIGVLLRRAGIAEKSHGDFVLRLAFFVTLPLLILLSISRTELTPDKAILPLVNILVNVLCVGTMLLATRRAPLERATHGALAMNTMNVNNAFMFPFVLEFFGERGFADAVLFDFGNALMVATVTYITAFHFSTERYDRFTMLSRILKGPVFWALAIGIGLSLAGVALPQWLIDTVDPVAQMTAPLILIALGIFFSLTLKDIRLVGLSLFIRMGLGFVFGFALAWLFGLDGDTFVIVALCSAAPIGFMALTFSSMAKLDVELTTSAVSLSILIGLFWIPLLMLLLR